MSSITVPKTIGQAKQRLAAITATRRLSGWERAAIVWAHTQSLKQGERTDLSPSGDKSERLTIAEALGLSPRTIDRARKAWKTAMEKHGAPDIKPGEDVPQSILDLDYPPTEETDETGTTRDERGARAYIARNPEIAVEAMKAVPAVAAAVTTAIAHDNDLVNEVERKAFAKRIGAKDNGPAKPTIIPDFAREKEFVKAISIVDKAIEDEKAGTWKPDPAITVLLFLLTRNLKDRAERIVDAQPAVHGEIEDFLATTRMQED